MLFPMKKIYTLFFLYLTLGLTLLHAQPCDFVNDISLGHTKGRNLAFSQIYFLVNAATNQVVQINTAGANFTGITPGFYKLIALNYQASNPPSPHPNSVTVGSLYGFTGGCFEELYYDGNSGTTVRVCGTVLCVGETLEVGSSKFKNNSGFQQKYALVCGGSISQINATGNFGPCTLAMNGCTVYVINHDATATGLSVGTAFPGGLGGCYEIHPVNEAVVVKPMPTASLLGFNGPICQNDTAVFQFSGTNGATLTYNLNGAPSQTLALNGSSQVLSINGITANQTLNLLSVSQNGCTQPLNLNGTVVMDNCVLPVAAIKLEGFVGKAGNLLKWTTIEERQTAKHLLERSRSAQSGFEPIQELLPNASFSYTATDDSPFPHTYYRVRILDMDGKITTSEPIGLLNYFVKTEIVLAPNPATDLLNISIFNPNLSPLNWKINNSVGQEVGSGYWEAINTRDTHTLNLTEWAKGVYMLTIQDETQRYVFKFVKD